MTGRVVVAALLSMLVGIERERSGHAAGLRTHMLVGTGASLFTALSVLAFPEGDPARIAAQVVSGIGFIGAGTILQQRESGKMHGLTTAASIWVTAAVGMACGSGAFVLATSATLLVVFTLSVMAWVGKRLARQHKQGPKAKRATTEDTSEEAT
ncbi:MAG: MgtC/SapB family protein [Thermoflexales bacterium]